MKIKLTENQINILLKENTFSEANPCNTLGEGKKFCNTLSKSLKGRSKLKNTSIDVFKNLRDNTDILGQTIKLGGSDRQYEERRKKLLQFYRLLSSHNACRSMRERVKSDLEGNLIDKQLSMVVNSDEEYSIFNRIDTHYSVQSYIITLVALDINKKENFKFYQLDTFDTSQIREEVLEYILNDEGKKLIEEKLKQVLSDESQSQSIIKSLEYSKEKGDSVEQEVKVSLEKKGYEVYDFGEDFGFVDYFGVDLVAIKDGKLYPIQASSSRKFNPKFYEFADDDCPCRAIYKSNGAFRVESPSLSLGESVDVLKNRLSDIGISDIELIGRFNDEDITDDFLRNLDRKMLKSGDTKENITKYLKKYLDSLQKRQEPQVEPEDSYFVDDDEEQEKSKIGRKQFIKELRPLQVELLKLQEYVKESGKSVVILFEGRDSAGKGSTIKKFTEYLQPQHTKVITLGIPTPEEKKNWFQRYENQIESGKINFFDRSWYNRGIVEPVMGYSTMEEYADFMENVGDFEQSLLDKGHIVFKFWLSITQDTQRRRFDMRKNSPLKYWKFSPNDEASIDKWDDYTEFKEKALKQTSDVIPWTVVDTNDKRAGALNAIRAVLNKVEYTDKDEKNLGMIYPEVVTTVQEEDLTEQENSFMRRRVDKVIFRKTVNPRVTITVEKYPNGQIVDVINPFNIRFPYVIGQVLDRGHETWAHVNGYEISKDGFNYKGGPEKKKFGIPVSMLPPHLKNL